MVFSERPLNVYEEVLPPGSTSIKCSKPTSPKRNECPFCNFEKERIIWSNHHFSGEVSSLSFQGFLNFSPLLVFFFPRWHALFRPNHQQNPENKLRTLMLFRSFAKWLIGWLTSGREFFQGKAWNWISCISIDWKLEATSTKPFKWHEPCNPDWFRLRFPKWHS